MKPDKSTSSPPNLKFSAGDAYDPDTCITAGELRGIGLDVPSSIPDCAWVRKEGTYWDWGKHKLRIPGECSVFLNLRLLTSFKWVVDQMEVSDET